MTNSDWKQSKPKKQNSLITIRIWHEVNWIRTGHMWNGGVWCGDKHPQNTSVHFFFSSNWRCCGIAISNVITTTITATATTMATSSSTLTTNFDEFLFLFILIWTKNDDIIYVALYSNVCLSWPTAIFSYKILFIAIFTGNEGKKTKMAKKKWATEGKRKERN